MQIQLIRTDVGVNKDTNSRFVEETEVEGNYSLSFLYKFLQSEFGRCTGHVYVDTRFGTAVVGWTFLSRQQYTDSDDSYLREWWSSYEVQATMDDGSSVTVPFDVKKGYAVLAGPKGVYTDNGRRVIIRRLDPQKTTTGVVVGAVRWSVEEQIRAEDGSWHRSDRLTWNPEAVTDQMAWRAGYEGRF